jgi:hypothetical protein
MRPNGFGRAPRLSVHEVDPIRNPGEAEHIRENYKLSSPLADELLVAMALTAVLSYGIFELWLQSQLPKGPFRIF